MQMTTKLGWMTTYHKGFPTQKSTSKLTNWHVTVKNIFLEVVTVLMFHSLTLAKMRLLTSMPKLLKKMLIVFKFSLSIIL